MSLVLLDRPTAGVALITLNRPEKYNALVPELIAELGDQLVGLADDESVRAIVLTGAGKAFCAGLDLYALENGATFGPEDLVPLVTSPQPIIAAINGVAVTGGLEIALACDIRIGSSAARFADTHARVGVVPGWGLTARLPQTVGQHWARRMSFTGDFVDAVTAERIGLITEITEPASLVERALEMADAIASCDPTTLGTLRSIYDEGRDGTGSDALAREAAYSVGGFSMADPEAFVARREAVISRGKLQG